MSTKSNPKPKGKPHFHKNKPVRVVLRKLPASKDYTQEQFESQLQQNIETIGLKSSAFHFEHFIPGKIR